MCELVYGSVGKTAGKADGDVSQGELIRTVSFWKFTKMGKNEAWGNSEG